MRQLAHLAVDGRSGLEIDRPVNEKTSIFDLGQIPHIPNSFSMSQRSTAFRKGDKEYWMRRK